MTLGSLGMRLGRAWGIGAVGFVVAAYGCGGSSTTDQNEPPARNTAGRGAAGHAAGGTSSGAAAGKSSSGGSSASGGSVGGGGKPSSGRGGGAGNDGRAGAAGSAGASMGGKGGGAGAVNGGSSPLGGEAGTSSGTAGEAGAPACNPDDLSVPFETRCLACAGNTCGRCLCSGCQHELETCQNTPGCEDVAQCVVDAGCTDVDCYCGTHTLIECLAGQSDGPCKAVILSAPGGHEPSLQDPSAGPASDAALDVGTCATGSACRASCQ